MLKGIDVSHWIYNKSIYWDAMSESDFVIMKATEGKSYMDPTLPDMASDTKAMLRGYYHYARPENNIPEMEAKFFVDVVKKVDAIGDCMLILDYEGKALEIADSGKWARQWCDQVYNLTGVKPLIYLSKYGLSKVGKEFEGLDYGLWIADWTTSSPANIAPWKFWALWQYSVKDIDRDYFNGNEEQFKAYCRVNG